MATWRVVAAGVHHADALAVPRRAHLRGERHVGASSDRQGVHVGAQGDTGPGRPPRASRRRRCARRRCAHREPSERRWAATMPAVRTSRLPSSGWACRSRRQAMVCACMAAMAASISAASRFAGIGLADTVSPGAMRYCGAPGATIGSRADRPGRAQPASSQSPGRVGRQPWLPPSRAWRKAP